MIAKPLDCRTNLSCRRSVKTVRFRTYAVLLLVLTFLPTRHADSASYASPTAAPDEAPTSGQSPVSRVTSETEAAFQMLRHDPPGAAKQAERLLESEDDVPPRLRVRLLWIAGTGWSLSGRHPQAVNHLTQAADLARDIGDLPQLRRSLRYLAASCYEISQFQQGRDAAAEAIVLTEQMDDTTAYVARIYNELAGNESRLGHYAAAEDAYRRGLQVATQRGDHRAEVLLRTNLAGLLADLGFRDDAIQEYQELLTVVRAEPNPFIAAHIAVQLGPLMLQQGFEEEAELLLREALQTGQSGGYDELTAAATANLGDLAAIRGETDAARDHYEAAWRLWSDLGNTAEQIGILDELAALPAPADAVSVSDPPDARRSTAATERRADELVALGDTPRAVQLYRRAMSAHVESGDWDAAFRLRETIGELEEELWSRDHAESLARLQRSREALDDARRMADLEQAAAVRRAELAGQRRQNRLLGAGLVVGVLLLLALAAAFRARSRALQEAHTANTALETQRKEQLRIERRLSQQQRTESLEILAAGIAHDFNNHLTAVSVSAELAEQSADNDETRTLLGQIRDVTLQAAQLTEQLVEFLGRTSDSAADHANLQREVEAVQGLLNSLVRGRAVLSYDSDGSHRVVPGAPVQIRQVLLNLVTNAVEACEGDGSIVIGFGTTELSEADLAACTVPGTATPGTFHYLRVCDNGSGIPDRIALRVFDPYFSTKQPGRGLGLSSVFGIARAAGGAIVIQPAEPSGTSVTVYLPAADPSLAAPVPPAAESPSAAGSETESHSERRRTVLFVDDESTVAGLMRRVVERAGFETLLASSADEALQVFAQRESACCCVVTDYAMPGQNGLWLAEEVRRLNPQMPVILCSGFADRGVSNHACVTEFLQKPYRTAELIDAVRRVALSDGSDGSDESDENVISVA